MSRIKLDTRLSMVASLVPASNVVADIGTDHAYLLCHLIEKGVTPKGIAADINKGPLENARQTVIDCGISDKVELILSDGLQNVPENSADCIVLAGMGGILISEIIEKALWLQNPAVTIVAQPMTHAEVLRKFFCDNGFVIIKEKTATDGKRYYVSMSAVYIGEKWNTVKGEMPYCVFDLESDGNIIKEFDEIPLDESIKKPKVGVVGEIYVKYSPLANNHLEDFLVKEGAEIEVKFTRKNRAFLTWLKDRL